MPYALAHRQIRTRNLGEGRIANCYFSESFFAPLVFFVCLLFLLKSHHWFSLHFLDVRGEVLHRKNQLLGVGSKFSPQFHFPFGFVGRIA